MLAKHGVDGMQYYAMPRCATAESLKLVPIA